MSVAAAAESGLLQNRPFLAIWSAQILSQVAANAITFALIVRVAEITKSNTSSSLLILFAIIPAVLFGIIAGVVVDRTDRKRVLVLTNAARAVAVAPLLFMGDSVVGAYLVNFVVAAITVFFVPAESATLPAIVRKRDLMVANSLFTFTFNGAFLTGFILLAPVMIRVFGFEALFAVTGLMFAGAAVLCITLPSTPAPSRHMGVDVAGEAVAATRQGVSEAITYLKRAPVVAWALVYIAVTYTLVAVAGALAPGFVREVLGLDERSVLVLVAPAGAGVILGIILLNVVGTRVDRSRAIRIGLVGCIASLLGFAAANPLADLIRGTETANLGQALGPLVAAVGAVAFVFGIAYAWITIPAMTLIQEELHDEIRGRIFGVLNMLVSVFSFLPLVIVGPIADLWGVSPVFLSFAVIVLVVRLWGRAVRHVPHGAQTA